MSPVAPVGEGSDAHVALLLDEMHSPAVAQALRTRGHDVMAAAEATELRAMSDDEVFVWAAERSLTIVTENVKDFRRLMSRVEEAGLPRARLLFTSSRRFPRSRRNPGPLFAALAAGLSRPDSPSRPAEAWLRPA
jgi:uncharacterized protein DUF5615